MEHRSETPNGDPLDEKSHYVLAVLRGLRERDDGAAVRWNSRTISGRELHACVVATTAGLRREGVGPGSVLGLLTEAMSPLGLVGRYAAHLLGATVVHLRTAVPSPSAPPIAPRAQARIIRANRIGALLADASGTEAALEAADLAGVPVRVLPADTFGSLDGSDPADAAAVREGPFHAPEPAVVTYTSGSTGEPKGVAESFAGMNARILAGYPALTGTGRPVFLATAPVSHADGPFMDITLSARGTLVLPEVIDADTMLRAIEEEKVTATSLSVPELYAMLDHPDLSTIDVSSLRQLLYTGYPASPERLTAATKYFGDALLQGYGLTETGPLTLLLPHEHLDPALVGTVGRALPGVEIVIRDEETGEPCPTGVAGEVCVRSPIMMSGYVGEPELTASVLRDGWLHTGDLGHLDEAGYLGLEGRIKDVIKVSAAKIHPALVEQALLTHPAVANAAVYGCPDTDGLERVHAAVVLRPGTACTAQQLRDHVGTTLPSTQAPVRIVVRAELPRTASGRKIDRPRLRREDSDTEELA